MRAIWIALLLLTACEKKMPPETWNWHPVLTTHQGRLHPILSELPLGELDDVDRYPQPESQRGQIVLSNISDLSCFLTRQRDRFNYEEELWTWALAYYTQGGKPPYAWAYAALLAKGLEPKLEKDDFCMGSSFMTPDVQLTFRVKPVQGAVTPGPGCTLFAVHGRGENLSLGMLAGALGQDIDYVLLQGNKNNLYVELAIPGELPLAAAAKESFSWYEDGPYPSDADWSEPVLARLKQAYDQSGLAVCER